MAVAGCATRQATWGTRRCATAARSVARSLHREPASDVLAVLLRYDRDSRGGNSALPPVKPRRSGSYRARCPGWLSV